MAGTATGNSIVKATADPKKAPPFKIQSTITKERYLKMMIYGDYGVGKTFLAGTASDVTQMRDVLILSAESGDQTLDLSGDDDAHRFSDIDTIDITNFLMMGKIFEYLKLHCQWRDEGDDEKLAANESRLKGYEVSEADCKHYETVIIDSLSEVGEYCMNQLLGISSATKLEDEMDKPGFDEYGKSLGMMKRLIRNFRDLPMNVIFIAGRTFVQDDQKRLNYSPALIGQLKNQSQGFMDVVGYYVTGKPVDDGDNSETEIPRKLYVQPVGKFNAKNRFSRFKGSEFNNPTMKSILISTGLLKD